jgi:hypothetical protein
MAFDFVGKRMGVRHSGHRDFLREEFQGRHKKADHSNGLFRQARISGNNMTFCDPTVCYSHFTKYYEFDSSYFFVAA